MILYCIFLYCILFLLHPIDNTIVVQYQSVQSWLNYVYIIIIIIIMIMIIIIIIIIITEEN